MAVENKYADEMLTDDELDNVAGGTVEQTVSDSRFLNILLEGTKYHCCGRHDKFDIAINFYDERNDVAKSWASLGIEFKHNNSNGNTYKLNGNPITQIEAYEYAMKKVGRNLLVTPVN